MGVAPIQFDSLNSSDDEIPTPRDSLKQLQEQQQVSLDFSNFLSEIHSSNHSHLNWANDVEGETSNNIIVPLAKNDIPKSSFDEILPEIKFWKPYVVCFICCWGKSSSKGF